MKAPNLGAESAAVTGVTLAEQQFPGRLIGRIGGGLFGLAFAGAGIRQLLTAEFVRIVPGWPAWIPGQTFWAGLLGVVLATCGVLISLGRTRRAAFLVAAILVMLFLFWWLPAALKDPWTGFRWTNPGKVLALLGGAILLSEGIGSRHGAMSGSARRCRMSWVGRIPLAMFLIVCGVQHFIYAGFVDTLVPTWIPPAARFWTYFTGVALAAGGAGLILKSTARVAALLTAAMVFLWVLLLHIPRAVSMQSRNELDGVFEATAVTGVALLAASTLPRAIVPARVRGAPLGR